MSNGIDITAPPRSSAPVFVVARAIWLVLFLCLLGGIRADAVTPGKPLDGYVREQWTTDTGLPQNSVTCFQQTKDGYLWFGTQEGLVRFDGARFTVFDPGNTPEMFNRNVYCIHEDDDGTLWIGIGGGALRYRDGKFRLYQVKDAFSDVFSIVRASDGTLWFSSFSGVDRIPPGKEEMEHIPGKQLPGRFVRRLFRDREGRLLAAMVNGVMVYRNGTFEAFGPPEINEKKIVTAFAEGTDGRLWIGTSDGGVVGLRDGTVTRYTIAEGLPANGISSLLVDEAGVLWVGTTNGLARMVDGRFERYPGGEKPASGNVIALFADREGSLWIGVDAVGLFRLRDGKFRSLTAADGVPGDIAFSILGDTSGDVWVATNEGLSRRHEGRWEKVGVGSRENAASCLFQSRDGTVWVGSDKGLFRFSGGKPVPFDLPEPVRSAGIRKVFVATNGTIWLTTGNGLVVVRNGEVKRLPELGVPKTLPFGGFAEDFFEQSDGSILLSTFGGVVRFRDGVWDMFRSPEALLLGRFYKDEQGVLWITSTTGLWRFDNGKFARIGTREGLFDSTAWVILEDGLGNFWMSCNKGIYRVPRADLMAVADGRAKTVRCTSYGTADGMKNRECNGGGPPGWRMPNGELWFPTVKGVAIIQPSEIRTNQVPPPVVIENFTIDGVGVPCDAYSDIPPGALKVAFEYAGLSLIAADRVRFRYKLEGFDTDWVEAGTRRTAFYTNLGPGEYRFQVMACNNDGIWNETGASVSFRLRPHFYQTWVFYGLSGLAVISLFGAGYALRVRGLKVRERKLVGLVNERTRALREEKEKLGEAYRVIQADNERKTNELEEARQIQLSLLPKNLPVVPNLEIAAFMKTATEVGGDYYDFHVADDGTLTIAIGDATGHGLQAGMMVTATKSLFAMLAGEPDLAMTFDVSNSVLKKMKLRPLCMALIMAKLQGNRLDVCSAGMPPLLVYRGKTRRVEEILIEAVPLGSLSRPEYRQQPVMLEKGDIVLLSSDGFPERQTASGELFGYDRARAAFHDAAGKTAAGIVEHLVRAGDEWAAGHPPDDDVTFVVLKIC